MISAEDGWFVGHEIDLRPGDIFISRDGYSVRLLTEDEVKVIKRRVLRAADNLARRPSWGDVR